jgi:hypothetical protein
MGDIMSKQKLGLKLTVKIVSPLENAGENAGFFYQLTMSNTGPVDEKVVALGAYLTNDNSKEVPVESPKIIGYILIPSGDDNSIRVSMNAMGHHHNLTFYIKTKAGVIVTATKRDRKTDRRIKLLKLSRRINPKHKALSPTLMMTVLLSVSGLLLILLIGAVLLTHNRSTYSALGTITVSPASEPSKYYTLKVGSAKELASDSGVTDTILVTSSASHWYSLFSHYEYGISEATWPNGGKLTFQDAGCTVPNKKVRAACVADDGKAYYVGIETVGPDILTQLNAANDTGSGSPRNNL